MPRLGAEHAGRHRPARARPSLPLAVAAVASLVALAATVPVRAQAPEPVVMIRPVQIALDSGARTVEVHVEGAPAVEGFQLDLSFDPTVVAVTAVEGGPFLKSTGGSLLVTPRFVDDGRLTVGGVVTLGEGMVAPSGAGVLLTVTLAPLAVGGPVPLGLADVSLVAAASGDAVPVARTVGGEITVAVAPAEPLRAEAAAQATAMAASLPGGLDLVPTLPDVSTFGAEAVWLGLLVMGLAVVAVGWLVGRRPRAADGSSGTRRDDTIY